MEDATERARPPFPHGHVHIFLFAGQPLWTRNGIWTRMATSGVEWVASSPKRRGRAIPPNPGRGLRGDDLRQEPANLTSHLLLTTTMVVSLPPELLGAILAEVRSTSDLLQLRLTNTTLNELATPLAFKSVCLENRNNNIKCFKLIAKSRLAPHVREVVFQYVEEVTGTFVENRSIHVSRPIF